MTYTITEKANKDIQKNASIIVNLKKDNKEYILFVNKSKFFINNFDNNYFKKFLKVQIISIEDVHNCQKRDYLKQIENDNLYESFFIKHIKF